MTFVDLMTKKKTGEVEVKSLILTNGAMSKEPGAGRGGQGAKVKAEPQRSEPQRNVRTEA